MFSKPVLYTIVALFLLLGVGQLAWHFPKLPNEVASHFDGAGEPDGFMSKSRYMMFQAGLLVGLPLVLLGSGQLLSVLPTSMVNMPNREFWFHPDRKAETLSFMQSMMAWITIATQAFFILISQLVYSANVRPNGNLTTPIFLVVLVAYFVAIGASVLVMMRRFQLPPGETVS